jgi:hypothetical protein
MKLDIQFEELWRNAAAMGAESRSVDIGKVWSDDDLIIDTQLSTTGVEIDLTDVDIDEGLLSYNERQVLLYIPEHNPKYKPIEEVIIQPIMGNRFHIADCEMLEKMRARNRYERYKVINNISGKFPIYGFSKTGEILEGESELIVCKYCLSKLNYKGAQTNPKSKNEIAKNFNLQEFFSNYSSLFKYYPKTHVRDAKKGYSKDWDQVSLRVRSASNFCCGHCNVSLIHHKGLLHTHHLNGEKSDNSEANLIPLCADCHRKEPFHEHMHVKHADSQLLNRLRREQGLLEDNDWSKVFKYADPAVHGVLLHCQKGGYSAPKVGYEAVNQRGEVIAEFELAWPVKKIAVALHSVESISGWRVLGLNEATEFFGKRSS